MSEQPTPQEVPAPPVAPPRRRIRDRLALESILWLGVLFALLLASILLIMNTFGRRLVIAETKRRIEEAGDRRVAELERRSHEISTLVRAIAKATEALPKDEAVFAQNLPPLLDLGHDRGIAGGGYWPEPQTFTPGIDRRSFFWGRDGNGNLRLSNGYNEPFGPGYHNEEWYVPLLYRAPGSVFWSSAYTDPYTLTPKVTCSSAVLAGGRFAGAATVDLELLGLSNLVASWQQAGGGYIFLLDRTGKFLTFPKLDLVTTRGIDEQGNRPENLITADALAKKDPRFLPVANAIAAMDRDILARAKTIRGFDPTAAGKIDQGSYAIDRPEAETISAILVDPLARQRREKGNLYSTVEVGQDPIGGQPSLAFLFHVPDSYWKLVYVIPVAAAEGVATTISRLLVLALAGIILPVLALAYLFLRRRLIRPVTELSATATRVRDGDLGATAPVAGRDELGLLADSFNQMVGRLRSNALHLQATNAELGRSLQMTDTIMGSVAEGLFLLEPDLSIAPKYSAALRGILGERELGGADFLDLLRRITPAKTHDLTVRFLKLLFNPAKTDSVVGKINPLKEIEASFPDEHGQLQPKFLAFSFERIREGEELRQAMVTVSDVTAKVALARELAESKQRMERQAELLLSIMHVEPEMLSDFIEGAHAELERANAILRAGRAEGQGPAERQAVYRRLADQVFQSVHAIKGTAAMLRIDYFAQSAHRFEDKLAELRRRPVLEGNDFVPVVLDLSELVDSLAEVRGVIQRFGEVQKSGETAKSDGEALAAVVERFVAELAAKQSKRVALHFDTDGVRIPFRWKAPLKNALAQLVRNSLVHGLETPAERKAAGKPEEGEIRFGAKMQDGRIEVVFRDDGRGLDYARIVERAKELGKTEPGLLDRLIDREQNRWKAEELDALVFHPGFSTARQVTEDAGRGFGLAAVKDQIESLGGEIRLRQRPGRFCELQIVMPTP
ncbi:MAG TPA: HAMP domain-containing protein [Thermoanaerobaculia bacterium]|jgi:methyl-accepting chemotaxis protein/two-component sensor histidine kinase|nr:HAMP domain-containing protein [Thermoanaerobaculia bacterium]